LGVVVGKTVTGQDEREGQNRTNIESEKRTTGRDAVKSRDGDREGEQEGQREESVERVG
jgi:hypothetical protein